MEKLDLLKKANHYVQTHKNEVNKKYRLKFHLMGECGWINDPNGFVYYNGLYHCFFQYNPFEPFWNVTYWGHAISYDMIKWDYLPIALAPDKDYDKDGCFSGSAIEKDGKLYLIYTGHINKNHNNYIQTQCLAFSEDGIMFQKYTNNPIINLNDLPDDSNKKDFRDPKVFKMDDYYYMVIASQDKKGRGQILLYKSQDLIKWNYVNTILKNENIIDGDVWECPDLFSLCDRDILILSYQKKEGEKVLKSESIYFVGKMDYERGNFKIDYYSKLDYGRHFYAPQTTVAPDGRRLMIAWMDNWNVKIPTQNGHNWAGALTLPRQLEYVNNKLITKPIYEIERYKKEKIAVEKNINNDEIKLDCCNLDTFELDFSMSFNELMDIDIEFYDKANNKKPFFMMSYNSILKKFKVEIAECEEIQKEYIPLKVISDLLKIKLLVDTSSVEIFLNEGEIVFTYRIYPAEKMDFVKVQIYGQSKISAKIYEIKI